MRPALLLFILPTIALAQTQPTAEVLDPQLDAAIKSALNYLARQQQPDGAFQNRDQKSPDAPPRFSGPKVALTSLSLMAYLAAGRMPDAGRHGQTIRNGIEFILKSQPEDGYFGKVDASQMYGHAITTLALSELYGMESDARQRARVKAALDKAVRVILRAQGIKKDDAHRGGWRYEVESADSDLSVTGWCVLALRGANNAGIEIPKSSADAAAAYILRCYRKEHGGFAYQPGGEISIAVTGAAVLNLHLLDRGTAPEAAAGAKFLLDRKIPDDVEYPYYTRYYATQAAFQSGAIWPKTWECAQRILPSQARDGSFPQSRNPKEPGQTYATAMTVLTLSVPLRLLPVYQK